jgi:hypothetical protein
MRRFVTPDIVFTTAFLCIGLSALSQAYAWPFRAGLFPLATGLVLSCAALIKLLVDLVAAWRQPGGAVAHVAIEDEATEGDLVDVFESATRREWFSALGWSALFFVMLYLLGTLVTVPLFALIYLTLASRESLVLSGIYAFCCWVFIYGLFDRLLHVPLPSSALLAFFGS